MSSKDEYIMDEKSKKIKTSRRDFLNKVKQGTKFAVPTLVTFKISELHAQASVPPDVPVW